MSATARLDMRLQPSLKHDAERAATLIGARSLTEFVVQAIHEKTASVLDEKEHISLPRRAFDEFMAACEQASEQDAAPSNALKQAAHDHDAQGFA